MMKMKVSAAREMWKEEILRLGHGILDGMRGDEQEAINDIRRCLVLLECTQNSKWDDEIEVEQCEAWWKEDELELLWMIKVIHEQRKMETDEVDVDNAMLVETLHSLHRIIQSMHEQYEQGIDCMIWGTSCITTDNLMGGSSKRMKEKARQGIKWLMTTKAWIEQEGGEIGIEY